MEKSPKPESDQKIDTLSLHGRKLLDEIKARQEPGIILSPEVIALHLQNGSPVPEGTTKLIWAMSRYEAPSS